VFNQSSDIDTNMSELGSLVGGSSRYVPFEPLVRHGLQLLTTLIDFDLYPVGEDSVEIWNYHRLVLQTR
jgi:hypothetical protein